MPSTISKSDRALIDRAIAAGKVDKIAEGVSSEEMIWCPRLRSIVPVDPARRGMRRLNFGRPRCPKVADRRDRVSKMALTHTVRQIADAFGVPPSTIRKDIEERGLTPLRDVR